MSDTFQVRTFATAVYATKSEASRGRLIKEAPSPTRSDFQRDRDRIIHSGAFRKLRNKTQVFIENEGDYYRTRLTHSLEVAQIARSASRVLGLDEDLAETIALAHDLGHTCFGHAGEEALDDAMKPYGGFSHNEQTFRILTKLEQNYARFDGLNLTWETLEGVVKHNGPIASDEKMPSLWEFNKVWDLETQTFAGAEAQMAALADDIAYNTHDVDDGYRSGLLHMEDLKELPLFGPTLQNMYARYTDCEDGRIMHEAVREVIGLMVMDVLRTTQQRLNHLKPKSVEEIRKAKNAVVAFSATMDDHIKILRKYLHANMYRNDKINAVCAKASIIVKDLFGHFMNNTDTLPPAWNKVVKAAPDTTAKARHIGDYIAGMTDRFALQEHRRHFSTEIKI
jgi:dGTPase